jgi:putative peptide zinc metalloprotease protein
MKNVPVLPRFRSDLEVVTRQEKMGKYAYLMRDPVTKGVFELTEEDYYICRRLDGQTSLSDVQSSFERRFNVSLDVEQLRAFLNQLAREGLLEGHEIKAPSVLELFQFRPPETWKRWKLFNPGRVLIWLAQRSGWCYSRPFMIAATTIFLLGVGVVFFNFSEFISDAKLLFVPLSIFQVFAVMYLFLNIPQELARGITATRFGARPDEFVIWLAFDVLPRFYCVARGWEVREKAERSWILFTPTVYSFLMGGMGILMWKMTEPSLALHKFGLILSILCILDSFVRLNVFWPSEGYYVLCNWFNLPDFRKRAQRVAGAWVFRKAMPEPLSAAERRLFGWYGLFTTIITSSALVIVAYFLGRGLISNFEGTGAAMFCTLGALKYRKGFSEFLKGNRAFQWLSHIRIDDRGRSRVRFWFWMVSLIVISLFPYPYEAGGPFRFLPIKYTEVHTQVSGEIKQVSVKFGDWVQVGQTLALLDPREHQKNLEVTAAELEKGKADLKLLEVLPKPEAVQQAKQQAETAETSYDFSSREATRLKAMHEAGAVAEEQYQAAAKTAEVDAKKVEEAHASVKLAESGPLPEEIEAQKALVRDLETRLKFYEENVALTRLVAPIAGRVATPYVDMKVGQVLPEGGFFAVIEDSGTIQAEVQLPECDIPEVHAGAQVKVRPWAYPTRYFYGQVVSIAPIAEQSGEGKIYGQVASIPPIAVQSGEGKMVRVLTEIPNPKQELKTDMTGEAKIEGHWKPTIVAFSRMIVRFFMVEVWSWFP